MGKCETCGNVYDKTFNVEMGGVTHTYDSFECAQFALAPTCGTCGCRIIGHGVEVDDTIYCCASCSYAAGQIGIRDRIQSDSQSLV